MTWGVIVISAIMATNVAAAAPRGPAWHCHPRGGSCVAVEPGMKAPYPKARQRAAWAFLVVLPEEAGGTTYSAFTSATACGRARAAEPQRTVIRAGAARPVRPTRCEAYTADRLLARIMLAISP